MAMNIYVRGGTPVALGMAYIYIYWSMPVQSQGSRRDQKIERS